MTVIPARSADISANLGAVQPTILPSWMADGLWTG